MKPEVDAFFKDYNKALDRDVTIALLNLFYKDIQPDQLPALMYPTEWVNANKDLKAKLQDIIANLG